MDPLGCSTTPLGALARAMVWCAGAVLLAWTARSASNGARLRAGGLRRSTPVLAAGALALGAALDPRAPACFGNAMAEAPAPWVLLAMAAVILAAGLEGAVHAHRSGTHSSGPEPRRSSRRSGFLAAAGAALTLAAGIWLASSFRAPAPWPLAVAGLGLVALAGGVVLNGAIAGKPQPAASAARALWVIGWWAWCGAVFGAGG